MENTNANPTLVAKVEGFKIKARESLRMELISARLSRIGEIEGSIKHITADIDAVLHTIKVENYEISKLDTEHPNFEKTKKTRTEKVEELNKFKETLDKEVEDLNTKIAEQKEGIAKIESGETKVSLDALNTLVEKMIKQDALNSVK